MTQWYCRLKRPSSELIYKRLSRNYGEPSISSFKLDLDPYFFHNRSRLPTQAREFHVMEPTTALTHSMQDITMIKLNALSKQQQSYETLKQRILATVAS